MPTHVALLRGINVGGRNKVAMADLRALLAELGHTDVATYIQSGNAVFTSGEADPARLADELEQAIAARLNVSCGVVVVTAAELAQVIEDNPFPGEDNPRAVHAVFRRAELTGDEQAQVAEAARRAQAKGCQDQAVIVGRTMFLHTPDGLGRSELSAQLSRTTASRTGTARNWATVGKLRAMLGG
ncbi:MAG TPA: DUF1697 domain-containing protein [Streptosporangiaceae bacterium]